MSFIKKGIIIIIIFLLGWLSADVYSIYSDINKEQPFSISSNELKSPSDWIKESEIELSKNQVIINIDNATWVQFTDTNSMDPVIDIGSNAIEIKPSSPDVLKIGDIISYDSNRIKGNIIHRIISIEEDENGIYFITKGDNNQRIDPEKIRFDQIKGVVVGILY